MKCRPGPSQVDRECSAHRPRSSTATCPTRRRGRNPARTSATPASADGASTSTSCAPVPTVRRGLNRSGSGRGRWRPDPDRWSKRWWWGAVCSVAPWPSACRLRPVGRAGGVARRPWRAASRRQAPCRVFSEVSPADLPARRDLDVAERLASRRPLRPWVSDLMGVSGVALAITRALRGRNHEGRKTSRPWRPSLEAAISTAAGRGRARGGGAGAAARPPSPALWGRASR